MKPFEHAGISFEYNKHYDAWLGYKAGTPVVTVALAPNGQYRAVQNVLGYVVEGYGPTPQAAIDALKAAAGPRFVYLVILDDSDRTTHGMWVVADHGAAQTKLNELLPLAPGYKVSLSGPYNLGEDIMAQDRVYYSCEVGRIGH
jgi:hypothetical protein